MASGKSGKKTIGIGAIACTLVISACFLLSIIQTPEAYGEKKKVSGTYTENDKTRLTTARFSIPDSTLNVNISVQSVVLHSDDPDWNNARFFTVCYNGPGKVDLSTGFGTIIHPSGDQTFIEYESKLKSSGGVDVTGEAEGIFLRGTGKFTGIKARYLIKWKSTMTEGDTAEWEVQYFYDDRG